jgi:hypothetical protein
MKKFLSVILIVATVGTTAQIRMPAPSPTQTIKQDFGLASVELIYSRPSLKGRKMIGVIEPYGTMWRTGANAATKIRFTDPVTFGGTKIDSGSYALYTIPQKDEWTVILNKGFNNSGISGYKESDDVARIKIKPMKISPLTETLTMQFGNIKPEGMELSIAWEDVGLNIPIATNIKDRIKGQMIESWYNAAQYYFDVEKNNQAALNMINLALDQPDPKPFYMVHYKARIQKELGDKKGAIATANESMKLAKDANNANYVLLNEKLISDLK